MMSASLISKLTIILLLPLIGLSLINVRHKSLAQGTCSGVASTPYFTLAYGNVSINGSPAPVGTVVKAISPRQDTVGCFEVSNVGDYGLMYIYGEDTSVTPPIPGMRAGETVSFSVNGLNGVVSLTLLWQDDRTPHLVDLAATSPPPTVDFSASPTNGLKSLLVTFSNESTGTISSYLWNFGDGGTSTLENPSYTYNDAGSYTVILTATGPGGSTTETKVNYIEVYEAPQANFSGSPRSGSSPLNVSFSDLSTGTVTSWLWDFGHNNMTSPLQNPTHVYTAGSYTVSLTVDGPAGPNTITKPNYITVTNSNAVLAEFSATPRSGCNPLTVDFSDASSGPVFSWFWTFGDGGTSTAQNPSHTYNVAGDFTVSLWVNGPGSSDTEVKTGYITVDEPPTADFVGTPTSGIAPLEVSFTNQTQGDYTSSSWNFGDGGTSMEENPTHQYSTPGTYSVVLVVSGCSGDSEVKNNYITVYEPVIADFSATPRMGTEPLLVQFSNLTTGDATSYQWDFGDDKSSTLENPGHIYQNAGFYTVVLTATGPGGTDSKTYTDYITVTPPLIPNFDASPRVGPPSLTVVFTDTSQGEITAWLWNFGDDFFSSSQNPVHTYTQIGLYTVSLTVSNSSNSDTLTKTRFIEVTTDTIVANFSAQNTAGPIPLTVEFSNQSVGDITDWLWDFGDGGTSTLENPVYTYTVPGTYTVNLTATGPGGSDIFSHPDLVKAYPPVTVAFSATPTTGIAPQVVTFTNLSEGEYDASIWRFGDGAISAQTNPTHTYQSAGIYTVSLMVSGLGGSDTLTKTHYITIYQKPEPGFAVNPASGPAPLTVNFTNTTSGDFSESVWRFGNGITSTLMHPTYTYTVPGAYTPTLTVSGIAGTAQATATVPITVYVPVKADFTATNRVGETPLTVIFTNTSGGDFGASLWNFGGDGESSNAHNPAYTYTNPDVYTVSLRVSGLGGADTLTRTRYITVTPPIPVQANFESGPNIGLEEHPVTFTNTSSGSYSTSYWDFGDGANDTETNPVHTYNAGSYTVSLTIGGPGGTDTLTKTKLITVYKPPLADFAGLPREGDYPLTVSFFNDSEGDFDASLWNFGDGYTSTLRDAVHTYTSYGSYTVSLTIFGPLNSDTITKADYITVNPVPVQADFIATPLSSTLVGGMLQLTMAFSNTSTGDFESSLWDFGDGAQSTLTNPGHVFSPGTFTVILTVSGAGGTDSHTQTIDFYPEPSGNFIYLPLVLK